jgi:signal transduction histidine kinase
LYNYRLTFLSLRRTLANILSNAFTFTPAGGKVTVKLLETTTVDGQSAVAVQIEDTGVGMSDEFLASGQLFQPFRQG